MTILILFLMVGRYTFLKFEKNNINSIFLKMCSSDWYNFFQKTWNWILDFISYFTFSIILYFIFVLGVTHVPNPSFAWIMKKWVIQAEHTGVLTKNLILIRFYIFMHRHPAPSGVETRLISIVSKPNWLIVKLFL